MAYRFSSDSQRVPHTAVVTPCSFALYIYYSADYNSQQDKDLQQKRFHNHFVLKKKLYWTKKIRKYTADYVGNIYSRLI